MIPNTSISSRIGSPNTNTTSATVASFKKDNEKMKKQMADQQKREQALLDTVRKLEDSVEESRAEFQTFRRNVLEEFNELKEQIRVLSNSSPNTNNNTNNNTNTINKLDSTDECQEDQQRQEDEEVQENEEDENMISPSASPAHNSDNNEPAPSQGAPCKRVLATMIRENRKTLDQIDLRLQLQENTYFNGRILWRIDHFKSRRRQVVNGQINALHSAPSYTKPQHGYKFCLRMYPNGDGIGAGTHLSLFIVIMKSDYDCLLPWPFNNSVKFMLINQRDRSKDMIEKMVPHKNSSSFQQPTKEMNIASGCPLFAPLDSMEKEGFLVDDTLFIEVVVEQG